MNRVTDISPKRIAFTNKIHIMDNKGTFMSYNSMGLRPSRMEFIKLLLNFSLTFLLVQESLHFDNNTDYDYHCYPVSGIDSAKDILYDRPYGRLLTYYHNVYLPNDNYSQVTCTEECVDGIESFLVETLSHNKLFGGRG